MSAPGPSRWRVPVERLRTHQALVDHLDLRTGDVLLDLGCGNGFTMATAASRVPGISLIGMEVDAEAMAAAESWLAEIGAPCRWILGDVGDPLPLPDGSVSRTVCHDVLEYLDDPVALLAEANRVLQPGGRSVWSHVDYDAIVIGGADRLLTRRIGNAYGDASYLGSGRSDAQMGRRLASLVDKSPLRRCGIDAVVLIATELQGPGRQRVEDIAAVVRRSIGRGESDLAPEAVDEWIAALAAADGRGEFFYSQTAYVVAAEAQPTSTGAGDGSR
jgi:SAM-dependent methyltransferase